MAEVLVFGSLVIGYLFCAGAGAGACCVLSVMALFVPRESVSAVRISSGKNDAHVMAAPLHYRRLFAPAYTAAFGALALGAFMLLLDLGRMSSAPLLAFLPTPTYITFGFWALVVSIVLTGGLACVWAFPSAHVRLRIVRAATWAALAAGFAVAVYTGLLLSSMPAVPFWASPLLPVLFTLSALSCGSALMLVSAAVSGSFDVFTKAIGRTVWLDVAVMVFEALAAALLIASAVIHPYAVAAQSASMLLSGPLQTLFLLGFGGVGIAVPLVLESISALGRVGLSSIALTAASCVLVGGFILRYCIVAVGAHPEVWAVVS
ncbi:MAG: polysulfide reductase NrfD [Eggerthellaceae bacterium]|nr:polysulfide reductase NrfD [Eggerthellaceae bacterium]